jgi:mutator protein MutT
MFEVAVVYLERQGPRGIEILLGEKLTGLGVGKIVGPGGKLEAGESPVQCAIREVSEEVGVALRPESLRHIARIDYPFQNRPSLSQRSHAFVVREWEGEPVASPELAPSWWSLEDLPLDRMWADASLWLPRALRGEFLVGEFLIGEDDRVIKSTMTWSGV